MKHHFQKIALLAFASLLTFSACKKDNDNADCGNPADFFPFMATGHQLTYAYDEFFFGNSGDMVHTYGEQDADGNFKVNVTGNPLPASLGGIDAFFYRACGDKFWGDTNPVENVESNWQYKADAQVGDTWSHDITNGKATYTVLETGLTVNTLAGPIPNCAKITYNQQGTFNTDTIYWSDEVGWVKYEGFLLSYELKSKNF